MLIGIAVALILPVVIVAVLNDKTFFKYCQFWRNSDMKLRTTPPISVSMVALAGCLCVMLLFSAPSYAQQDSVPNFRFDSGKSALKIPFELYNNLIFIRTRVNNSFPLWFLIDTGAEVSVIKQSRAESLGLTFGEKGSTEASGGSVDFLNVKGVTLSLPGAYVLEPTVVAFPLESFEPLLGRTADGIIGADLFNRFVVDIDYGNKTISLYDPKSYRYFGRGEAIPISVKQNSPYVDLLVTQKGRRTSKGVFAIDTGSDSTVVLNGPFARTIKFGESNKTIESSGLGAGGATKSLIGRIENVTLGRYVIQKPLVRVSEDEKGELASAEFSGLIGGELLRRFRVIFDYGNGIMILESNEHLAEPDEFDMSGITFSYESPGFEILKVDGVRKNSPATRAGLAAGDIVTAIDGKPASKYNTNQLRKMFRQNGRRLLLEIRRGNKLFRTGILLRRLV